MYIPGSMFDVQMAKSSWWQPSRFSAYPEHLYICENFHILRKEVMKKVPDLWKFP